MVKSTTRILPKIRKGALGQYGYMTSIPATDRRKALVKGVRAEGYSVIVKRLSLIRTYNKNNAPVFKKLDFDVKWLQKNRAAVESPSGRKTLFKNSKKSAKKTSKKTSQRKSKKSAAKTKPKSR